MTDQKEWVLSQQYRDDDAKSGTGLCRSAPDAQRKAISIGLRSGESVQEDGNITCNLLVHRHSRSPVRISALRMPNWGYQAGDHQRA